MISIVIYSIVSYGFLFVLQTIINEKPSNTFGTTIDTPVSITISNQIYRDIEYGIYFLFGVGIIGFLINYTIFASVKKAENQEQIINSQKVIPQALNQTDYNDNLHRNLENNCNIQRQDNAEECFILNENMSLDNIVFRGMLQLEEGNFKNANKCFEWALNIDPKDYRIYIGKLMLEYGMERIEELKNCSDSISNNLNYKRAIRYDQGDNVSKLFNFTNV